MKMFSRLSMLCIFFGITLMFVGGTADAQQKPFLTVIGADGFDVGAGVGDEVAGTFQAGYGNVGASGIMLSLTALNINVTSHAVPGTHPTGPGGFLVVRGVLTAANVPARIQLEWTNGLLSASVDIVPPLAEQVFQRYRTTILDEEIRPLLPDVLRAFGKPEIQNFLDTTLNISAILDNPGLLTSIDPEIDYRFVGLLTINQELRTLFMDEQFHNVLKSPHEINKLVGLIEAEAPIPPEDPICPEPEPSRATTLAIVSGSPQEAPPGTSLTDRFVVIVLDQHGDPFSQTPVTFKVIKGEGSLSTTRVIPNEAGHASTDLTLGPDAGANWVEANVNGISQPQVFTANAIIPDTPEPDLKPTKLEIVSGNRQSGQSNTKLQPFVVAVVNKSNMPVPDIPVTFTLDGDGQLSVLSALTDKFGLAETTLTLGEAGQNKVVAAAAGIAKTQTFIATATASEPTKLLMMSGDNQEGRSGTSLVEPFVVGVFDKNNRPVAGIPVTFLLSFDGDGQLSPPSAQTDQFGLAETTLTLGAAPGTYQVFATVQDLPQETKLFTATTIAPPEDVNLDGRVSIADIVTVAQNLQKPVSEQPRADVNGDGKISLADLVSISQYIANAESGTAAAPGHQAVSLDTATVQSWLRLAQVEDDGSLAFQEGIANLEQLLASLVPKQTALLANYPNPFNPETWIPYQLAKPADVTVSVYSVERKLVRTLDLGHQVAGAYHNKNRAAYWDGRNEFGEPIASGLYFYTLTASDFTATRKMLIRK